MVDLQPNSSSDGRTLTSGKFLFEQVKDPPAVGMVFFNGTNIRTHHKPAGVAKKGEFRGYRGNREALGRSRKGFGS